MHCLIALGRFFSSKPIASRSAPGHAQRQSKGRSKPLPPYIFSHLLEESARLPFFHSLGYWHRVKLCFDCLELLFPLFKSKLSLARLTSQFKTLAPLSMLCIFVLRLSTLVLFLVWHPSCSLALSLPLRFPAFFTA